MKELSDQAEEALRRAKEYAEFALPRLTLTNSARPWEWEAQRMRLYAHFLFPNIAEPSRELIWFFIMSTFRTDTSKPNSDPAVERVRQRLIAFKKDRHETLANLEPTFEEFRPALTAIQQELVDRILEQFHEQD